jgi:hypothetical protein
MSEVDQTLHQMISLHPYKAQNKDILKELHYIFHQE